MTKSEADDVALKLIHTADWHIGKRFQRFGDVNRQQLSRARLDVLDNILKVADHTSADAILCAGDLFDEPSPTKEWWGPVAEKLRKAKPRPIFLLPGNHDPLQTGSVYEPKHPFRAALPIWVHVVDDDNFTCTLNDVAVLHARPCRSQAGQDDPALALPTRENGDDRIRIGLVHGSTFDAVDCQTNFPIAKDAAKRRGFDYLAIGDTHSFRNVPPDAVPPVVYPGAPEATSFGEPTAGNVVAVFVSRARKVTFRPERVAFWTWNEQTVRSLAELRELHTDRKLSRVVLRLILDLRLGAADFEEAERILSELKGTDASAGRVGILELDRQRMSLDTTNIESELTDLPDVLKETVARLRALENDEQQEIARAALYHLYRLLRQGRARS